MKVMTKLLLINWHYFQHELIEFGQLNFLTGKNASGKSVIIDALQLLLLGDTSGSFFNKAAKNHNERGNRTLKGYLMGELGDDENSGFKYLRNDRFTSYIAVEFFDQEKNKCFTAGCCFDIYSENEMPRLFFIYDSSVPENHFMENKTPLTIRELRELFKRQYPGSRSYTTDVGRDFRITLYGRLGGLRERFGTLLKKAVSFNPDINIQEFISQFVCDAQQTVDVSQMQDNIRSYKSLESNVERLQKRIAFLEKIAEVYQKYTNQKENERLYSYLLDQAEVDLKSEEIVNAENIQAQLVCEITEIAETITRENQQIQDCQAEREALLVERSNNEEAQAWKALKKQIEEKQQQLDGFQKEYDNALKIVAESINAWNSGMRAILPKLDSAAVAGVNPMLTSLAESLGTSGKSFMEQLAALQEVKQENIAALDETGLARCVESIENFKELSLKLETRVEEEQTTLAQQRQRLEFESKTLERGQYPFPQDVLDLKAAISARLHIKTGYDVPVRIVAEAAEIKNMRWRNVIEGYLHTQKYYLIVPPEYFQTAVNVFDAIKRQQSIYGTGIVDIEKLQRIAPYADEDSLAEEIITEDPAVQLFINYTLGRVKKCDRVQDLRRYRTAVTDEGMLYQNFVVRAMSPLRWAKPAIGKNAVAVRLAAVQDALKEVQRQSFGCANVVSGLRQSKALKVLNKNEIQQAAAAIKNMAYVPVLKADVEALKQSLAGIDISAVEALEQRINDLERTAEMLKSSFSEHTKTSGKLEEQLRSCKDETIPKLTEQLHTLEVEITENYTEAWREKTGQPRYQQELSVRGDAAAINRAFPRELSRSKNSREEAKKSLLELRSKYNQDYILGYDIGMEDNEIYDNEWLELSENELPDYVTRIEDTRQKTFERFQEDFLSRLQNNINDIKRQIDELNNALKDVPFGDEHYRFRIIPKPEYKRYYDMIVDSMLMEGYNLYSAQFNEKYKTEIAELFAIMTDESSSEKANAYENSEKRIQMFTDYRTYLSFDMEIINNNGETQRLSKTLGKKSGGETQTPFYVAVLASFFQLYRMGRDKKSITARLIIFDEAFSKMDGERITRSIELLRKFNFQAILAAPPDKIGDIATLVDRNICVLRSGRQVCTQCFDPRGQEAFSYE